MNRQKYIASKDIILIVFMIITGINLKRIEIWAIILKIELIFIKFVKIVQALNFNQIFKMIHFFIFSLIVKKKWI